MNTKIKIKNFLDLFIQFLIIVSIILFSINTLPDISLKIKEVLDYIEIAIIFIFTIEYLIRISVADKSLKYIFSFYGLIDLISILPFYLTVNFDFRIIRIFRLFRLFRILKFVRYSNAIDRYIKAFREIKEELLLFMTATIILLYISAVGIYFFEYQAQPEAFKSIFHSLWWSVATLTTVGYGDIAPITIGGKIFTFIILMIGLSIVSIPAGLISSAFSKIRKEEL